MFWESVGTGLGVLKNLHDSLDWNGRPIGVVIFSNYSNSIIRHRCLSLGAKAFFWRSCRDQAGCGAHPYALDRSRRCQTIGVTTAEQWIAENQLSLSKLRITIRAEDVRVSSLLIRIGPVPVSLVHVWV